MISTSYIERQNLTCRQDNNRISRKTIGFSKKTVELDHQMTLYFANFNYCRKHRSLKYKDDQGKTKFNCPAKQAGLIDHVWSLHELLTFPYHKIETYWRFTTDWRRYAELLWAAWILISRSLIWSFLQFFSAMQRAAFANWSLDIWPSPPVPGWELPARMIPLPKWPAR